VTSEDNEYERIRVIVETNERSFRGFLYKPIINSTHRLSDHLNEYERPFLCLSDVSVNDRGQTYRSGDKRDFVAISVASITFVAPMRDDEP
jgi:hypothetical protein